MSATPPAPAAAPKLMTADEFWDFCNLPENENRSYELHRGKVVEMPRPTKRHGRLCLRIGWLLENYAHQIGPGYPVSNDSGVILDEDPDTVVGPDVAYYVDATRFEEIHPKWGENVPILAVEVLSPNDRISRVNAKVSDYLRNGVRLIWVVDFEDQQVTVYRPNQSLAMFGVGDTLDGGTDLPGLSCPVAELFRLPGEAPPVSPPAT